MKTDIWWPLCMKPFNIYLQDGDTSEEHSSGDRRRRRAAHRHDDVYEYGGQSDDSMPSP